MVRASAEGPIQILQLLTRWDTAGLRFDSAYARATGRVYCFIPKEQCLSEEPGWDLANVVTSYAIKPVFEGPDSAVFEISFEELGTVDRGGFSQSDSISRNTVWFKQINSEWRIVSVESQMPPHLSKSAAYRLWSKAVPDSIRLKSQVGIN
jgi:hypothetical protein